MGKEVPSIESDFVEKRFIGNFREKPELFNSLFANQCLSIMKSSLIFAGYKLLTDEFLSYITFAANDRNIIKGLDSNKPHSYNIISYLHAKDFWNFYSQTIRPDHQSLIIVS